MSVKDSPTPPGGIDYVAVEESADFVELKKRHRGFVFPLAVFFLLWYFVYVLLSSFATEFMSQRVWGDITVGLLFGLGVVEGSIIGSIAAALIIGLLGQRSRDRNSITAVLMPFGLGVGILCLALYPGRASTKFGLLTGQIVAVDDPKLGYLALVCGIVVIGLLVMWRPLTFSSLDADVAAARGVPVRAISLGFMLLLGLAVAASIQIVGALLVLAILVTPAAAAMRISTSPVWVPILSMLFALASLVGGILLALGSSVPISPYVTTISFLIYLVCRVAGRRTRDRRTLGVKELMA